MCNNFGFWKQKEYKQSDTVCNQKFWKYNFLENLLGTDDFPYILYVWYYTGFTFGF